MSSGSLIVRLRRDIRLTARLGPTGWIDLLRAVLELAAANRRLGTRTARDLLVRTRPPAPASASRALSAAQQDLVKRVTYSIYRVGVRVPWRADCLVQALAAQRWLQRRGIATALFIGVRKDTPDKFEAHAWLRRDDTIITGGDISGFVAFVLPELEHFPIILDHIHMS